MSTAWQRRPPSVDALVNREAGSRTAAPSSNPTCGGASDHLSAESFGSGSCQREVVPNVENLQASRSSTTELLGAEAAAARGLAAFRDALPPGAAWPLKDHEDPADLWRAEPSWWSGIETDALGLLRQGRPRQPEVVGAAAALAVDAWRGSGDVAGREAARVAEDGCRGCARRRPSAARTGRGGATRGEPAALGRREAGTVTGNPGEAALAPPAPGGLPKTPRRRASSS